MSGEVGSDEDTFAMKDDRYRLLLDTLPHGVQENDCDGRIVYSNRAHHEILGYGPGELSGRKIWDMLPSDDEQAALRDYLERLVREQPTPVPYLARNRRKDGSIVNLQVDWNYIHDDVGALKGFLSVITDVTDRHRTEALLSHRTRGLATLLDVSRGLAARLDIQHVLQTAVDGVTRLVGLDTAAVYLLDDDLLTLRATTPPLPPDFPETLRVAALEAHPHIREAVTLQEPVFVADFRREDLTAAERAVVEQRNLRTVLFVPLVVDAEPIGVFIVGSVGAPFSLSKTAINLSRTLANLAALALRNAQLFADKQRHAAEIEAALTERIRVDDERKVLQDQLLQAQKMESIGRLAGGVAHDFNNMLNVILGHAELALEKLDPEHALYQHLVQMRSAAQRSAELTRQLLAFARKQTIAPERLNLNDVVADMLDILRRLIGEDIKLDWRPGADIGDVRLDRGQVDQIMANLVVNARDAISGSGRIEIETKGVDIDDAVCATRPEILPGPYVSLTVRDDGTGMSDETVANIFDPFFTTKGEGEGTGLGLSTVYGIVGQNGGFIDIDTTPGGGTTFRICFPRCTSDDRQQRATLSPGAVTGGGETVLLVEDEPMILELGREILEHFGYRVLAAQSPTDALAVAKEGKSEIAVLVADVVMPGLNGRELAEKLRAERPHLKTLFISGYTDDVIAKHGVLEEGVAFLLKPFSPAELASRVRELLAGGETDTDGAAPEKYDGEEN